MSDGKHTIQIFAVDNAGNKGVPVSLSWTVDTTPPVLTVPSKFSVFPTSPSGAAVTYSNSNGTAATATDATSGVATLTYSPPSGSALPIGNTIVAVTATDNAGNSATGTFTLKVLTPIQATQQLIKSINSTNLTQGTKNNLDSKLNAVISSLTTNQNQKAKNQLNQLIVDINAQTGKKIPTYLAPKLISKMQDIINSIP